MNDLRKQARELNIYFLVVHNNLAKIALKDSYCKFVNIFSGPLMIAFSRQEPVIIAKLLFGFIKKNNLLKVRYFIIEEKLFGPEWLRRLSNMPGRKEALAMLCNIIQVSVY